MLRSQFGGLNFAVLPCFIDNLRPHAHNFFRFPSNLDSYPEFVTAFQSVQGEVLYVW